MLTAFDLPLGLAIYENLRSGRLGLLEEIEPEVWVEIDIEHDKRTIIEATCGDPGPATRFESIEAIKDYLMWQVTMSLADRLNEPQ